jgi:hypothetical protein
MVSGILVHHGEQRMLYQGGQEAGREKVLLAGFFHFYSNDGATHIHCVSLKSVLYGSTLIDTPRGLFY